MIRRLARALAPWLVVAAAWAVVALAHLIPAWVLLVAGAVVIGLMVREAALAPTRLAAGRLQ